MKKLSFLLFLQTIITICDISSACAQTGLNIHIGKEGIDIKPDAFTSYYQAPPNRTAWLQQQNIPAQQWPLLFEIARAGNVTLERVMEVRRKQSSWQDVLNILNVPSSHFYYNVPAEQQLVAPYERAYRYYGAHPTEIVRWSDGDLYKLASVKYISDSTNRPAHQAVTIYQSRPHFIRSGNTTVIKQNHTRIRRIGHSKHHRIDSKQNHVRRPGKIKQSHGKHKKHGKGHK